MAVYDANGAMLNAVFDADGNSLISAYDAAGNVIFSDGIIVHTDQSSGPESGYVLTSETYENTYALRQLADWTNVNFQSVIFDTDDSEFYRLDTGATVNRFSESMSALSDITLPDTGGHKNDAAYHNGYMYMLDGTASDPKALYVWNTSTDSITKVLVPVPDNANGSTRVVAGITGYDAAGSLYLVSRDMYGSSDIDHQTGDVMCVYRYHIATNTAELLASYPWDCVYVQGAAFYNGVLYVTCNTATTGSASNYTGITVKCIRTDTWTLIDEMTCSGNFEPEGMDTVDFTQYGTELTMGIVRWSAISKFVRFTPPYELTAVI